ncbi:Bug family tripartite tricarboxylate transporter substrate binding protein [Variovorax sp. PBL-E5]|uniref:Bug family tripartite tricarboxylate transporter substrate binding protein n=1 Tax=Variovorax sp. PBL-E5 TaxID=434014 RepID=UPI00131815BE|nr:tripartite tricarboxylate transporter substrate binding protein [Variovorax sp. PBL-E5]VTU45525.1 Tripartite tricarboxylate transporter family receptor [Variovorax sp. PBL-E5]
MIKLAGLAALGIAWGCVSAHAQEWKPTAPIEFVVPSGPGGAADQYVRAMGHLLAKHDMLNGQSWVVVNRPSGTGVIALQSLQQRPGNPHVLTLSYTGITISHLTGELKLGFSDFTPVALFLRETMAVTVRSDSSLQSAGDLVASLKRDPASVRFGYLGHHVLISLAKPLKAAGVDLGRLTLAPYRSSAEALTALLGGYVDAVPASTPNLVGMVSAGSVRPLAVSSAERLDGVFAHVPTWREQGVDSSFSSVYGLMLPKDVPPQAVRFWEGAIEKLSNDPEWQALLARNGAKPLYMNQAKTIDYFDRERTELAPLVKELKLGQN